MKMERLEARVSSEQKQVFQQAAQLLGRSLTDFVVSTMQEASHQVIQQHHLLQLSLADREQFVKAILNPAPPNENLKKAMKNYAEMSGLSLTVLP